MNATSLMAQMLDQFHELTPHKDYRNYVGMSGIGGCLYDLYMRAKHHIRSDDRLRWYGWQGQVHEAAVKRLLGLETDAMGTFLGRPNPEHELIADFDDRYRGHYDAVARDGTLVEIKSVNWKRFQMARATGAFDKHIAQVQAYMHHGDFDHCVIVYVCRDMPHKALFRPALPLWTVDVELAAEHAERLNHRAMDVLSALDGEIVPPSCTCTFCFRNWAGFE